MRGTECLRESNVVENASNVRGDADLVLFRRCHEVILLPGAHCGPVIQTNYSSLTLPRFEFAYIGLTNVKLLAIMLEQLDQTRILKFYTRFELLELHTRDGHRKHR